MRRDRKSLLWDAGDAAKAIADMTAGKSFADFDNDLVLRSAVERQFEILGEALNRLDRLDAALAAQIPDLRQIVAFRNILIHGYASIRSHSGVASRAGQFAAAACDFGRPPQEAAVERAAASIDGSSFSSPTPAKTLV